MDRRSFLAILGFASAAPASPASANVVPSPVETIDPIAAKPVSCLELQDNDGCWFNIGNVQNAKYGISLRDGATLSVSMKLKETFVGIYPALTSRMASRSVCLFRCDGIEMAGCVETLSVDTPLHGECVLHMLVRSVF